MSNQDLEPRNIVQAIEGMSLTYNPEVDQNLAAIIQLKISGEGGGDYYLSIANGKCDFSNGLAPNPTLTIESPAGVWLKIARKELSGAIALMSGKYKASG
jgi:putative sterol carrier protein